MKIAYLILCHTDPAHISRLVKKITGNTENEVFVHVDAKVNIAPFKNVLDGLNNVHLLMNRIKVFWGGVSAVEATILLMREALAIGKFDRYVLLQGLEYPIKNNQQINDFFLDHYNTEFILAQNISDSDNIKEIHKYRLYYDFDHPKTLHTRIMGRLNGYLLNHKLIPNLKRNYVTDNKKHKMKIFQGCAQFGLTENAVKFIVKFHDDNPKFNKFFRSMYAPDESYFHTIIYNFPFVEKTPDGKAITRPHLTDFENLTYFEYPVYVTVFKEKKDWPKLRDSGFLYFRKATSESSELLDYIDQIHKSQGEFIN